MPPVKANETMLLQKEAAGKAETGVYIFWALATVQFALGIIGPRLFLSSFYPLFGVMQLIGIFDFNQANLYGFLFEKPDTQYIYGNYVGITITVVAGLLIVMATGAIAGMNSKAALREKKKLVLHIAKLYAKLALASGAASILFLLVARMAA
ncbi:hypothetical protein HYV82_05845 [Candidatus Woesearchaeota archaeon]|nr:hypothetical protein [Candidatus Woesearchaeota archaeon]